MLDAGSDTVHLVLVTAETGVRLQVPTGEEEAEVVRSLARLAGSPTDGRVARGRRRAAASDGRDAATHEGKGHGAREPVVGKDAGVTTTATPETRRLRCALFVDFDNVYIGLQRLDPDAAEAFASSPGHWLAALEDGVDADGPFTRRFLVRSCYLNPSAFSHFRPNFTRAGFSVVDCPSLTQQGKSSADINLVLDAVDALSAHTRYDEFVILSADADFTPLALRCRAEDRRVTIVTAGPAASAYRAVADSVVTADELAELVKAPQDEPSGAVSTAAAPAAGPVAGETTATSSGTARSGTTTSRKPAPELPPLPPLQRQVVEVTDIPNLPPERYRVLLEALADDVDAHPFDRPETSRRVRDACQAAGEPIGRSSVNTVIAGVLYSGLDLARKTTARKIAETWADNVVGLCRGARMELSPQDVAAIRGWVSGGLVKGEGHSAPRRSRRAVRSGGGVASA